MFWVFVMMILWGLLFQFNYIQSKDVILSTICTTDVVYYSYIWSISFKKAFALSIPPQHIIYMLYFVYGSVGQYVYLKCWHWASTTIGRPRHQIFCLILMQAFTGMYEHRHTHTYTHTHMQSDTDSSVINRLILEKSTLVKSVITTFALYRISGGLHDKSNMGTITISVHVCAYGMSWYIMCNTCFMAPLCVFANKTLTISAFMHLASLLI